MAKSACWEQKQNWAKRRNHEQFWELTNCSKQLEDGEKDPRNLLYCFHLVQLISSWNRLDTHLSVLAEELFEVYSCYFPIEFADGEHSSGPDGSLGISKIDLTDALMSCFASNIRYAEFAIPFFLDKLTADVIQCKVDSLDALSRCTETYLTAFSAQNSPKFNEYSQQLWHAMFAELITSPNELVLKSCDDYFKCLLNHVISDVMPSDSQSAFMKSILSDCKGHLRSVATKTHKLTLNILKQCLALTCSRKNLQFFNDEVLSHVITTALQTSHEFNKCIASINTLIVEIRTTRALSNDTMDLLNRLSYFVIETFQNTVNNIVDRYEDRINDCLACLTHLLKMQSLSDEVCSTIGTSVCYEFWKTLGSDKLSSFDKNFLDLCLEVFSYLLESCSQERVNEFITHMSQMEGNGRHSSRGLFLILLQLSSDGLRDDENMRWKFSNLLRTFVLSGNEEDSDSVYLEDKIEISLMKRLDQDGENEVLNICKDFISTIAVEDVSCVGETNESCHKIEKLSRKVCRCLEADELETVTQIFLNGCQSNKNPLFYSLLNSSFITLPDEVFTKFTTRDHLDFFVKHENFGFLIAVCVNRLEDEYCVKFLLQKWIADTSQITDADVLKDDVFNSKLDCLNFLLCCHALIRRGGFNHLNRETKALIRFYLECLKYETWGQVLAQNAAVLVNGIDVFDSKVVRCMRTQPMFIQQLMYNLLPQLMNYRAITQQPSAEAKANWLLCLMSFLQSIPENLKTKLSSFSKNNSTDLLDIIPMALTVHEETEKPSNDDVRTFDNSCSLIINSTLTLLDSVLVSFLQMEQQSKVDSTKLVDIHQSLLLLAKTENMVEVRLNSLKCLAKIGKNQSSCRNWLNNERSRLTKRTVDDCLNDRKRIVRRAAVATKSAWESS